jgi:hypothetical protein
LNSQLALRIAREAIRGALAHGKAAGSGGSLAVMTDRPEQMPRRFRPKPQTLLSASTERTDVMLYTIAVVLLILWLAGLVTAYTMGGFIHVLLVIAIVMVLLRVIDGRAVV